ncbi:MAG: zinc ribbon domain-containing protein [Desulfovibrio sp.]|nr:zinc ribbon domain-containing protein [Desulfovibrio sp.]
MPIYEYKCRKCGIEFEDLVSGKASPPCPSCGDKSPDLLMSAVCVRGSSQDFSGADLPPVSSGSGGCCGCTASSCAGCAH